MSRTRIVSRIEDGSSGKVFKEPAEWLNDLAVKFIRSHPKSLKYSRTLKDEVRNTIYLWQREVEKYIMEQLPSKEERSSFDNSLSSIDYDNASDTAWHDVIEEYLKKYTRLSEDEVTAILNIRCIQTKASREL